MTLTDSDKKTLLKIAREAIRLALNDSNIDEYKEKIHSEYKNAAFYKKSGVFVTLTLHGKLRGCIGTLTGVNSVVDNVIDYAINAALNDNRFEPLPKEDFLRIKIEISVLTPMQDCALSDIRRGDGVYVSYSYNNATFLPQVWDQLPEKEEFMSQLCLKAGLSPDFWQDKRLKFKKYSVLGFEEQ